MEVPVIGSSSSTPIVGLWGSLAGRDILLLIKFYIFSYLVLGLTRCSFIFQYFAIPAENIRSSSLISFDVIIPLTMPSYTVPISESGEQISPESLGYGFEDEATRMELEILDDLQRIGVSKYLNLPQLVVVGDQSTGKSSVLQAVTEIPFPTDDKMCTRFATEIVLRRGPPEGSTLISISIRADDNESAERKKLLAGWRPMNFDPSATLDKPIMQKIFLQAEKIIFGDVVQRSPSGTRSGNRLSSSVLQITRTGPNETNFAIVDLPGLVRGNETNNEHQTAKLLVEKYLENPRSIVVVVVDIVDLERQEIIELINNLPDEESRVFDLIRNDPAKSACFFKEGWYGLRNRQPSELDISDTARDELEREFFSCGEWSTLDATKLGRHQLKKALIIMRNSHVKRSIPDLVSEVQNKLDTCTRRIDQLGEPRITNQAQFTMINRCAMKYSAMAEGGLSGNYEILTDEKLFARKLIRDDLDEFAKEILDRGFAVPFSNHVVDSEAIVIGNEAGWAKKLNDIHIYNWISSAITRYRGREDLGGINFQVKNLLWKQQIGGWGAISHRFLRQAVKTVESINRVLFMEACPDQRLRSNLQCWLQDDFSQSFENATSELQRLFTDELDSQLFTLHRHKRIMQQRHHDRRVQAITEKYNENNPGNTVTQTNLVTSSFLYGDPALIGILDTHDSLAAYYKIALHRFIDNFALQVIERHMLGPQGPLRLFTSDYVTQKLYGQDNSEELNELASEDPVIAEERMDLEDQRSSLEESKRKFQLFKIS